MVRQNSCNTMFPRDIIIIIFFFNLRTAAFKAHCEIWVRRSNFCHQASPRVSPRPKNPTASARCEPANLGTKCQHATSRPPKPLIQTYTFLTIVLLRFCQLYLSWLLPLSQTHNTTTRPFGNQLLPLPLSQTHNTTTRPFGNQLLPLPGEVTLTTKQMSSAVSVASLEGVDR